MSIGTHKASLSVPSADAPASAYMSVRFSQGNTMSRRVIAIFAFLWVSFAYAVETEETTFETSEGNQIVVRINKETRVPIPSENGDFKVLAVHFRLVPKPGQKPNLFWEWSYDIELKNQLHIDSIRVYDVTHKPGYIYIEDNNPTIANDHWNNSTQDTPVTREFVNDFKTEDTWFRVFKIEIKKRNGSMTTLHQPVVYTRPVRLAMLESAIGVLRAAKRNQ